jgi:hypothetical protein
MLGISQIEVSFENFSNILVGIAAIITSVVAIYGISTWKKQIISKAEFDLATRLMKSIYDVRSSIEFVRSPIITRNEIALAKTDTESQGDLDQGYKPEYYVQKALYMKRWEMISKSLVNLNTTLLEAKALWGGNLVEEMTSQIFECIKKLDYAIDRHLMAIQYPETKNRVDQVNNQRILASTRGFSEEDGFRKEVNDSIEVVEAFIRPKLRLNIR